MCSLRVGIGFDLHRLVEGRKLILGGVEIPYEKGLLGHSDADVLIHAIMDAILGAASLGDIGKHFPPSDEKYKDIDSLLLLREVIEKTKEKGYKVVNIDSVIICEKPKLLPFIPQMTEVLARETGLNPDDISIKATTMEGLGEIGEGRAIAAKAVTLVKKIIHSLD